ncbi:hypothetical protein C5E16_08375 [Clavibacter michiganensis]|uniref:Glycosyltransferase n=1 Tax=Clavibacter michiganensis TaxID=28447 RepID=A0A2S5VTT6_9MICO|nr:hypothetical protein C5E16_08375 [Clavibacter michiganensis]
MQSTQAVEFLGQLPSDFIVHETPDRTLREVSARGKQLGARRIIVPDGDQQLLAALMRVGRNLPHVTLLVMREPDVRFPAGPMPVMRQGVKLTTMHALRLRQSARVTVLKSALWSGKSSFQVANDPVTLSASREDMDRLRGDWGMSPSRRWFAILGAITERKNLPLIAEAYSRVADERTGILIAGAVDAVEMARAKPSLDDARERGGAVMIVNRMLTDVELDAAVTLAHCVVLAHSNEGPSGILGKAVMSGTRLLTAGALSLKGDAAKVPGSATWCELTTKAIAHDLEFATSKSAPEPALDMGSSRFTAALL